MTKKMGLNPCSNGMTIESSSEHTVIAISES